jgi:hypothetical protein
MTRMKEVSHTNPQDPRNVFGELFRRGPSTIADGGESTRDTDDATESDRTMKNVSHTVDDETRNSNRVWSRGSADEVDEE